MNRKEVSFVVRKRSYIFAAEKKDKRMVDYVLLSTEQIKSVVEEVLQKHLYNNVCALETENEDILSPKEVCKLLKVFADYERRKKNPFQPAW